MTKSSSYKGVYKTKENRWKAEIDLGNRKRKYLGTYNTPEEARDVYNKVVADRLVSNLQELGYKVTIEAIV